MSSDSDCGLVYCVEASCFQNSQLILKRGEFSPREKGSLLKVTESQVDLDFKPPPLGWRGGSAVLLSTLGDELLSRNTEDGLHQ